VLSALLLIASRPAQAQTETVLYNFTGGSDGGNPRSSLIFDAAGNLYGTTNGGGVFGAGTVFELSPNGSGGWSETVLYSFTGGADGSNPYSNMIFDSVGNLYGTTYEGGANGLGVVFELSPVGTSWTETVLYTFTGGTDGADPRSGVIMDLAGNLYGTTCGTQPYYWGTVFELTPSGGGWTERTIYAPEFAGCAGLTMDAAGDIFGTTLTTVFELSANGNGGWNPTVLHTFCSKNDGCDACGTPVFDQAGNLYGTTEAGGAPGWGTVYKLSYIETGKKKKGEWKEKYYALSEEEFGPIGGVVLQEGGWDGYTATYGTSAMGGNYETGDVFLLVPIGQSSVHISLWNFKGNDGLHPYGSLILDSAGNLYGTTADGGSSGAGVVFEVNPSPAVTTTTLTSSPNPSTYGQAVTFTAAVTPAPPDGETVSFMKGKTKTVLGTGSLSGGSASFTTSALPVGATKATAVYGGDLYFAGSTSNTVKQVVKKAKK
jgi:uncharacterized repeat protein (TIGR03803 family)